VPEAQTTSIQSANADRKEKYMEAAHAFLWTWFVMIPLGYFAFGLIYGWIRWHEANKGYQFRLTLLGHYKLPSRDVSRIFFRLDHIRWYHFILFPSLLPAFLDRDSNINDVEIPEKLSFGTNIVGERGTYIGLMSFVWPFMAIGYVVSLIALIWLGLHRLGSALGLPLEDEAFRY